MLLRVQDLVQLNSLLDEPTKKPNAKIRSVFLLDLSNCFGKSGLINGDKGV